MRVIEEAEFQLHFSGQRSHKIAKTGRYRFARASLFPVRRRVASTFVARDWAIYPVPSSRVLDSPESSSHH